MSEKRYSFDNQICESCNGEKGKYVKCHNCNGTGEFESYHDHPHGCTVCGGWKMNSLYQKPSIWGIVIQECKAAYGVGSGEIFVDCTDCSGTGIIPHSFIIQEKLDKLEEIVSGWEKFFEKHKIEKIELN